MGWEITAQECSARLGNRRVVHRNERGRALKKVPPPLVGHPGLLRLLALADGVAAHRRTCRQVAERLVQEAVAVPADVVELLAANSAWKEAVAQAGLVPAAAGSPGQEGDDLLLARRYRHPALPDEERILLTTADAVRHLAADADRTPGWEQDPRRSAPEVVAACAAALGVTADAAALHLMLLALPDPTDRRVRRWTGWSPAALEAAQQQVRGTGLVVEARRSRAGRSLFIPGPWLELKVPRLPVEAGKRALLPADPTRASGVHTAVVPSRPLSVLFADAWRSADPAKEEPDRVR